MENVAYRLTDYEDGSVDNENVLKTETDYYDLPDDVKAELIDGEIIIMESPRPVHQTILLKLGSLIDRQIQDRLGKCKVMLDLDTKLDTAKDTIVRPDISVICDPDKITDRRCEGSPDWIIEIVSPSNPGHDYIRKLRLYSSVGVREYWIIDPMKKAVIVYILEENSFDMTAYTFRDSIPVGIYDDFVIDFSSIDDSL